MVECTRKYSAVAELSGNAPSSAVNRTRKGFVYSSELEIKNNDVIKANEGHDLN